ncbi:hypothetical protein [Sphingobacterium cellulitidis]|uniref:hypothetical protein n=1 Tax=Sphingobacterium cellulitidis TaxID=1768011 RepID=UPI000B93E995|nr:hypothetical protein CHT99_01260 [Sphingobacterium cellulitidis]
MKRTIFLSAYLLLASTLCHAQSYVTIIYDSKHLAIVGENAAVRSAAEITHSSYLGTIRDRLEDINLNVSSVVLVQDMIHRALTEVDQALRSGLTVRQIGQIGTEIIHECDLMLQTARDAPYLLLFAEDVARQMKNRGVNLAAEVSEFVLKEGQNVLMDYEKRDALLRKIVLELRVMRALTYSMHRAMYYAKLRGILRTINPYDRFINQDRRMVDDIIYKVKILKD